jgi:hypothetical protein
MPGLTAADAETMYQAILCAARKGEEWRMLYFATQRLPDHYQARLVRQLSRPWLLTSVRELLSAIIDRKLPPIEIPKEPEPVKKGRPGKAGPNGKRKAAEHLAQNPSASLNDLARASGAARATVQDWRESGELGRWLDYLRRAQAVAALDPERRRRAAEEFLADQRQAYSRAVEFVSRRPNASVDAVAEACGITHDLALAWRRLPQFKLAVRKARESVRKSPR